MVVAIFFSFFAVFFLAPPLVFAEGSLLQSASSGEIHYYSFLAEGCTRPGFDTWLLVDMKYSGYLDPDCHLFPDYSYIPGAYAKVYITYYLNDAPPLTIEYPYLNGYRMTVNVDAVVGEGKDVSFVIDLAASKVNFGSCVPAERVMYFSYSPQEGGGPWHGASAQVAIPHSFPCAGGPDNYSYDDWYYYDVANFYDWIVALDKEFWFVEGNTLPGFDEWICVLNPNKDPARLEFSYFLQGGGVKVVKAEVPPKRRATFFVPDHVGRGKEVSLRLRSDIPVFAERPTYFAYRSQWSRPGKVWTGGHTSTGYSGALTDKGMVKVTNHYSAYARWFPFVTYGRVPGIGWGESWLCVYNPHNHAVKFRIVLNHVDGVIIVEREAPPLQRATFSLVSLFPYHAGYSHQDPGTMIVATKPSYDDFLFFEVPTYMELEGRQYYPAAGFPPSGGFSVIGSHPILHAAGPDFPEGCTLSGFETWFFFSPMYPKVYTGVTKDKYPAVKYRAHFSDGVGTHVKEKPLDLRGWITASVRLGEWWPGKEISGNWWSGPSSCRIVTFRYQGGFCGLHGSMGYLERSNSCRIEGGFPLGFRIYPEGSEEAPIVR
ncbi:MAG: hypothetical protein QXH08_00210 [Candidatus Hadarchaeales archaeon]